METRAALPGLKVEYSADDGVTWSDVTSNMEVEGKIKLRTRSVCKGDQRLSFFVRFHEQRGKALRSFLK